MGMSGHNSAKVVVVLVEDEVLTRIVTSLAFADAGFEVVEHDHADAALAHLEERSDSVHAIFTDIHVPGEIDGLELAHHARLHWPRIALLIASGLACPKPAELPEGCRFLPKPYDPRHAVEHLREMLAR
jgi:CheY-like chemotaxis protein